MKTIATAAVLMMLAAPAWAEEPQRVPANDPANSNEPIVLSASELDGVTAGDGKDVRLVGFGSYSVKHYSGKDQSVSIGTVYTLGTN